MRKIFVGAMMLGGLAMAAPASGQLLPVSVEVRGGAAFPTADLAEVDLATGWGFEGNVQVQLLPVLAAYVGYDRFNFSRDDDPQGGDASFTDQGFSFGGQLSLPTAMLLGASPFLRGGGIYHQAKFDFENDAADFETERGWGYEVGGGLTIPLGMVVSFTPAVRYRSHALNFDGAPSGSSDDDISYVLVDLGLKFGF